jgi:hypothetical protein
MSQALKSSTINPFLFMKIKQLGIVSGVALATLVTAGPAQAALVVVPPGLNPGQQFRLVFVTNGTRNATSTNISDYNNKGFCPQCRGELRSPKRYIIKAQVPGSISPL